MSKITDLDLDTLPEDVLIQILLRIPTQELHDTVMFVCRKLYHMIRTTRSFVYTHLHHSTPRLLFGNMKKATTYIVQSQEAGNLQQQFEISNFSFDCTPFPYWASCNGLMLEYNVDDNLQLAITNPVTKQHFTLPPFTIVPTQLYPSRRSAIAYAAARMEYKVVRTYYLQTYDPMARRHQTHAYCAILTVGVDKSWRHVDTRHFSRITSGNLNCCPLVTQGFVHWPKYLPSSYVLTLNIETEIITRIPVPPPCRGYYQCLETGEFSSYLSLLVCRGHLKWDVWEMKPETGEWKKLPNIDLEAHTALLNDSFDKEEDEAGDCLDCKTYPVGWLKYREVIVFVAFSPSKGRCSQNKLRAIYNIKTRDISLFKSAAAMCHPYPVHRCSLVRLP